MLRARTTADASKRCTDRPYSQPSFDCWQASSEAELTLSLKLIIQDTVICAALHAVTVSKVAPDLQQDLPVDLDYWYQRFEVSCCGWAAYALLSGGALTRPAFDRLQVDCL